VVVVHSGRFWLSVALAGCLVVAALLAVPMIVGVRIECARPALGAVPACEAHEHGWLVTGSTTRTFAGIPGVVQARDTAVTDDTPATVLDIDGWTSRPLWESAAHEAQEDFDAFVRDERALAFDRRVPGGLGAILVAVMLLAMGPLFVRLAAPKERAHAVTADEQLDELVVEKRRWRGTEAHVYTLSSVDGIEAENVEETEWYRLVLTTGGERHVLFSTTQGQCKRAASRLRPFVEKAREARRKREAELAGEASNAH
jgi:hypothetical protein